MAVITKERGSDDQDPEKDKSKTSSNPQHGTPDGMFDLTPSEMQKLNAMRSKLQKDEIRTEPFSRDKIRGVTGYVELLILGFIQQNGWSVASSGENLSSRIYGTQPNAKAFRKTLQNGLLLKEALSLETNEEEHAKRPVRVFSLQFDNLSDVAQDSALDKADDLCRMLARELGYEAIRDPKLLSKRAWVHTEEQSEGGAGKYVYIWHENNEDYMFVLRIANPAEEDPSRFKFDGVDFCLLPALQRRVWWDRVYG